MFYKIIYPDKSIKILDSNEEVELGLVTDDILVYDRVNQRTVRVPEGCTITEIDGKLPASDALLNRFI